MSEDYVPEVIQRTGLSIVAANVPDSFRQPTSFEYPNEAPSHILRREEHDGLSATILNMNYRLLHSASNNPIAVLYLTSE